MTAPARASARSRSVRGRDVPIVLAALLVAALLAGHGLIPDRRGLGTVLDSFLPWFGLAIVPVAVVAFAARSRAGTVALLVPVLVWAVMFGGWWLPKGGGERQLRVVTQNIDAANPDPARTARQLVDTGADLVAVEEMNDDRAAEVLDRAYPHQVRVGTVGLWSRFPVRASRPLDLGLGWNRALRAEIGTTWGALAVYVVHLASVRPGEDDARDATLLRLAETVRADDASRLLIVGDLNTASTDRQMAHLVPPLVDAQRDAGYGFGFTWPSGMAMTRPDQVLFRGLTATGASVADTDGSDHRGAVADLRMTS